uniref:Uncharacterized protein n=1 Tax=Palpitomonas bilix TaxID=652834 RepID=A0A7S3GGI5_9EUKA|mmetsp:Transcript_48549/g.125972  ORF Transcript_48549/g.125972 Transcript_48549/m.125972 type:complete len:212 (+) Transcript_48549:36-671(+)
MVGAKKATLKSEKMANKKKEDKKNKKPSLVSELVNMNSAKREEYDMREQQIVEKNSTLPLDIENEKAGGESIPENTTEPQYSLRLNKSKTVVVARVKLHRIPEKCINFEVKSNRFHVDTLSFSKKYFLDVPYPGGVEVDASSAEGLLEYGILKAVLFVKRTSPVRGESESVAPVQNEMEISEVSAKRKKNKKSSVNRPSGAQSEEPSSAKV